MRLVTVGYSVCGILSEPLISKAFTGGIHFFFLLYLISLLPIWNFLWTHPPSNIIGSNRSSCSNLNYFFFNFQAIEMLNEKHYEKQTCDAQEAAGLSNEDDSNWLANQWNWRGSTSSKFSRRKTMQYHVFRENRCFFSRCANNFRRAIDEIIRANWAMMWTCAAKRRIEAHFFTWFNTQINGLNSI